MISHISIKDFAIIEDAEIDFYNGLNIITGETGSGKSIVIEAVSLALGSRADTAFIRSGKKKATVQLAGELDGEEIVITRELSSSGRNLCRLNGEIVTLSELNRVCRRLADIHGQYDHQSLLNPENHIRLVDAYRKEEIAPLKAEVAKCYEEYMKIGVKLKTLLANENENRRRQDFMRFELDEITKAMLTPGEDAQLEARISILKNSEKIYEALSRCQMAAAGEDADEGSALALLNAAVSYSGEVSALSPDLEALSSEYSDIYYRLQDLAARTRELRDSSMFSQTELDEAIARYELIENLKQKYGNLDESDDEAAGTIEAVLKYADKIAESLKHIDSLDDEKSSLAASLQKAKSKLAEVSEKLSRFRHQTSKILEAEIIKELEKLNFKDARFVVYYEIVDADSRTFTEDGFDKAEFLISTNPGEDLKPLSKIASGGEMSRIMLAFKKITGDYDGIPTMIFDEIDAGISGITASIVGKNLAEIAENHQIICITHLPQIAAFGENNYRISKSTDDGATYTSVVHLSEDEKVEEIARLIGGINITETALNGARELISQAKSQPDLKG